MKVLEQLCRRTATEMRIVVVSDNGVSPAAHSDITSQTAKTAAVDWARQNGVGSVKLDPKYDKMYFDDEFNELKNVSSITELNKAKHIGASFRVYCE